MTRAGRIAVLPLIAAALAGCSGSSSGGGADQRSTGAHVFANAGCGGCHSLAAAGATGTTGPDLDALAPDAGRVERQVRRGGRGMPAFAGRLSAAEIAAVARYVAEGADAVTVAAAFEPDGTSLEDCAQGDGGCFEQAFANLAFEAGPERALAVFAKRIASDPTVRVCHRIAHALGAGGLAHYEGDVGRALADGDAVCWSGYYHGVLEHAFAGVASRELAAVSRRLCAGELVRRSDFVAYQCVHGLGHGLMIHTGYDLPLSLETCDALATPWDRSSCSGGVFMENLQTSYGTTSRWLRVDDPLYPCSTVAERHKLYCYLMVTSRILDVTEGDWRETVHWCRKAEKGWVATCFQSLGRDASGRTLQDAGEILRICALAGGMEGQCVYGAARDITSMDAGASRSTGLCRQAPARWRSTCFNGVGTIVGSLSRERAARRGACRAHVPVAYLEDCFAGAGAG